MYVAQFTHAWSHDQFVSCDEQNVFREVDMSNCDKLKPLQILPSY